jgi:excisionase family DNA binding protein
MSEPLLRDLSEAAGALRVSASRVRQEVSRGRLSHVRMGRRLLFRDQDLREYIDRCTVPTTSRPREPVEA